MPDVVIPYKPREWAKPLHNSTKQWIVLVLHRRAGKTTAALNHLQRDALRTPLSRYAYIAPTYKQAKNIAWDLLKFYASPIPGVEFNESELTVKYPNGSKLTLYGADNPDSLRGIGLWGVVFDEYSQQPSNIFTEVISKALADHLGYAIWIGTPKGKNEFHRLYLEGKKDEAWMSVLLTIDDTLKHEKGETVDNLRISLERERKLVAQGLMTQDEFAQEWFCSFDASIKGAYYAAEIAKARAEGRIKVFKYDPALLVHTVWDLGKGPNMAVGFYQRLGPEVRKIDYLEGSGQDALPDVIAKVKAKPYLYGKHFAPHDIEVTELGSGVSRLESAKALGITFEVVPRMPVDDGIHAGRLMFGRLWINETLCQPWLDSIAQYRQEWDDKRGMFKEAPLHDWTSHGADEYRYAAIVESKMGNDPPMPQPTLGSVQPFYPQLGI